MDMPFIRTKKELDYKSCSARMLLRLQHSLLIGDTVRELVLSNVYLYCFDWLFQQCSSWYDVVIFKRTLTSSTYLEETRLSYQILGGTLLTAFASTFVFSYPLNYVLEKSFLELVFAVARSRCFAQIAVQVLQTATKNMFHSFLCSWSRLHWKQCFVVLCPAVIFFINFTKIMDTVYDRSYDSAPETATRKTVTSVEWATASHFQFLSGFFMSLPREILKSFTARNVCSIIHGTQPYVELLVWTSVFWRWLS